MAANVSRERINRIVCLNNLRQMGVGSQLYALMDPQGRLTGNLALSLSDGPGDDLNWLYGLGPSREQYVRDLKTFACPSAQNTIRTNRANLAGFSLIADLFNNGRVGAYGQSYEVRSLWPGMIDKTLCNVSTHKNANGPAMGTCPGPANVMLIYDAMDTSGVQPGAVNDIPGPYYAHGEDGANMLFADSHAEWVSKKNWNYRYAVGTDGRLVP